MDSEIWLPAFRYENNYEVSNFGNIRSVDHWVNARNGGRRLVYGKNINKRIRKIGYVECKICAHPINGYKALHRIVAETFVPNPNNCREVNHKDGNKQNNRADNLEWCTRQQNVRHSFDLGLNAGKVGQDHPTSYLKDEDIIGMRNLYDGGMKSNDIASLLSIPKATVYPIVTRRSWKHLL